MRIAILVLLATLLLLGAVIAYLVQDSEPGIPLDHPATADPVSEPARMTGPETTGETRTEPAVPAPKARPKAAPEKSKSILEIEVQKADLTPVAEARVVVFRNDEVLGSGKTDEKGVVRFDGFTGAAMVVAAPANSPPFITDLPNSEGKQRISLPGGAMVAGVVRVNGNLPAQPLQLSLWTDRDTDHDAILPAAVRKIIGAGRSHWRHLQAITDDAGRFQFRGLPTAWSGNLTFPRGYATDSDRRGFKRTRTLKHPDSNVVLELLRLPRVSGRVVGGPDRKGLARARVGFSYASEESGAGGRNVKTDESGRFQVTIPLVRYTRATLTAAGPRGLRRREIQIDLPLERDRDVGDIAVGSLTEVRLLVKSKDGRPLTGVVAVAGRNAQVHSPPTNEHGKIRLRVAEDEKDVTVAAIGYEARKVALPKPTPDPLTVILQRSTKLTVRVECPGGNLGGLSLRVETKKRAFATEHGGPEQTHLAAGASEWGDGTVGSIGIQVHYNLEPKGIVMVPDVLPHVLVRLAAWNPISGEIAVREVRLDPGEWKEEHMVLSKPPRKLSGLVVGPDGKPLQGAVVKATGDDKRRVEERTDKAGRFELKSIFRSTVHLLLSKSGYAPRSFRDYPLPAEDRPCRFMLHPGSTVKLTVVDTLGQTPEDTDVSVSLPGFEPWQKKKPFRYIYLEKGKGVVRGLPPGPVTFKVEIGGKIYDFPHDSNREFATLKVPAHGRVRVGYDLPMKRSLSYRIRLVPEESKGAEVVHWIAGTGRDIVRFPAVLPGRYTVLCDYPDENSETETYLTLPARGKVVVEAHRESRIELKR